MPELPEVETIARDLRKSVLHQSFSHIQVCDGRVIRNCSQDTFTRKLQKKTITQVTRIGKAVVLELKPSFYMTVQPMMSGKLVFSKTFMPIDPPNSTKIIFKLSSGAYLQYNDFRMFGRINLLRRLEDLTFFNILGPDPFSKKFNAGWIAEYLKGRRAPIKPLLMDQRFVAGIGNIYASEILFRSRINPLRSGSSLKSNEIKRLHSKTVGILKEAVTARGTSMRTYRDAHNKKGRFINRLKVYDREAEHCSRCGEIINRIVQAGRSTFFCQHCQM